MKAVRALLLFLNVSIALITAAAIYVWFIGPIDAVVKFRAIHWSEPGRPLRLATGLLILRLILPRAGPAWRRLGQPALAVASKPYVWAPLLAAALAFWLYSHHRTYLQAVQALSVVRGSGRAQIGLVTRPVLSDLETIQGAALPPGAAGRRMEISCGMAQEAAQHLELEEGGIKGRLLLGGRDPRTSRQALTEIATCALGGGWRTVTVRLPDEVGPSERLFFDLEAADPERAARFTYWSRPVLVPEADARRPNLLLISLDTLRADHLGAYGYARPVSPNIDRLAREGTLFERAISQAPWTTPAHMTLFTSLYPSVHAVDSPTSVRQRHLGEDKRLFAEILSEAGYATAAFTGSGAISALYGFWRGFSVYDETDHENPARGGEDISRIFEGASSWLVDHHEIPFFMFFHSYEPHTPYVHRTFAGEAEGGDETAEITALYDGDIFYADGFIGQLLALIDGLGIKQRTIVVLLSDHGEELEQRYPGKRHGHGHTVYDELLHVPLIIVAPGRAPAGLRVGGMVRIIDVMPTLLELLDLPIPRELQGVSLAPALRGEPPPELNAFAESTNHGPERKAVYEGRFKYIKIFPRPDKPARDISVPVPPEELFDLKADPEERHSILARGDEVLERLRRNLQALVELNLSLRRAAPEQNLDEETIRKLKALGYIQ